MFRTFIEVVYLELQSAIKGEDFIPVPLMLNYLRRRIF